MSELPDWEGVPGAPEHRTVGSHRAWCFNDGEWCYPESELMCPCCHGVLGHEEMWFDPKVGPPERAILQDLIAELRGYQEDRDATEWLMDSRGECLCDGESPEVDRCTLHNTRQVTSMADRAEARLREVQGER